MVPPPPGDPIVLVGAGHAHLHLLAHPERLQALGREVLLVEPGDFWYSGLATGMVGGMYAPEEDRIDVARLAEATGVRLIRDRVVGVHRALRRASLASGATLPYGLLSFNVGSETDPGTLAVRSTSLWWSKPIRRLPLLRKRFEALLEEGEPSAVVVGGGASGCEFAAALAELARRRGRKARVLLLTRSHRLIPGSHRGASGSLERSLRARGVEVRTGVEAQEVMEGVVRVRSGDRYPADVVVVATGLRAPAFLEGMGLTCTGAGLVVDRTLRSVDDPHVFGVGDCIDFAGMDLPKLGVFGVRQAPVLLRNLEAACRGAPPLSYRPQRRRLRILNLGMGEGLAIRGPFWWRGRLALRLKDRLDQSFLDRHR